MSGPAGRPPLPAGTRLELDPSVRPLAGGSVLAGGHPGRLLRLTPEGVAATATLVGAGAATDAERRLGRQLVDAGMAHPVPGVVAGGAAGRVTVVLPVRDRADLLEEALDALGTATPVVVVDDGSAEPGPVAEASRRHGARLVRRPTSGGPSAARNDGVAGVATELVAFVDSDCVPPAGWLDRLVGLFDDPALGAVGPRIRPVAADRSTVARYGQARSPLDLGPAGSLVGPGRLVRYLPTAALVVRAAALADAAPGGDPPFDPALRFGEDVDLVWRVLAAGWQVRYEPTVVVRHHEPTGWAGLLRRRYRYGTSAAPLSRRHPGRLAPVELRPWPTAAAAAALAGHPAVAAGLTVAAGAVLARRVRGVGIPAPTAMRWSAQGTGWTVVGLGRATTVLAWPALAVAIAAPGAGRGRRRLRLAAAALAVVPPAVEWWQRRPALDPVRWALASMVDDAAYGTGVWAGCLRERVAGPLLPTLRWGEATDDDPTAVPGMGGADPDPV